MQSRGAHHDVKRIESAIYVTKKAAFLKHSYLSGAEKMQKRKWIRNKHTTLVRN